MPCILGRESLPDENVAEVAAARRAGDLRAPAVGVRCAMHGSGDLIVEARPPAIGFELVRRPVQRSIAAATDECPGLLEGNELTGEGTLGAFMDYNALLFGSERVEVLFHHTQEFPIETRPGQVLYTYRRKHREEARRRCC